MKPIPQILKHYLKYNPETGELFWIIKPAIQIQIGDLAGSIKIVLLEKIMQHIE